MQLELKQWAIGRDIPLWLHPILETTIAVILLVAVTLVISLIARRFLIPVIERAVKHTSTTWDDTFVSRGFFRRLGHLLPVIILYTATDLILPPESQIAEFVRRGAMTLFVIIGARVLDAFLLAVDDIYGSYGASEKRSIKGYLGAAKIILYVLAGIFIVAILTDKSPWGIFSVLGGLTAVLLLIFKDTILGFVANLQLAGNDMVQVGDWIEMPKYGADGDVIDVSIHTVKVQNWDKTITTIPAYALVSDAFKNWRGMSQSGGRRIKRALHIDMNSIRFCSDEMLQSYERICLLKEYLANRKQEIDAFNQEHNIDTGELVNGRRQTNIGIFRAYVVAYLRQHPKINQNMTFLVRHLAPTPQGLPIEIYVFSRDQVWANYEAIQADIFDHILAAVPRFGLRLFQYPSSYDFRPQEQAMT